MKHKVFIGFDSREKIASDVCEKSLKQNSKKKIHIKLLDQKKLRSKKLYYRKFDPLSSTEFTFTRFLIPYLSKYKGWSLFCDCDFLFLEDVEKLFSLADNKYAVMCVKHDHKPNKKTKMDGSLQSNYPRKNWSSLVLWNCSHKANKKVNLKMINSKTGKYLHRFGWLKNKEIGSIPVEWNWLVGWYKEKKINKIKALHFTEGGPWFKSCKIDKYSKMWVKFAKKYSLNFTKI